MFIPDQVNQSWAVMCPERMPCVAYDQQRIYPELFRDKMPAKLAPKLYVGTVGAPACGKTSLLSRELQSGGDPRYGALIRIDPDEVVMPAMVHTRGMCMALHPFGSAEQQYDWLRPGSNIIANNLLNTAVAGGYHIAHDTTLSDGHAAEFLQKLGQAGYTRRLLVCAAPDVVREDMEKSRQSQGKYHVTPQDFVQKAQGVTVNMARYFENADELKIFWTPDRATGPVLAAVYQQGQCSVMQPEAMQAFVAHYEQQRQTLLASQPQLKIPAWAEIEQTYTQRFAVQQRVVQGNVISLR